MENLEIPKNKGEKESNKYYENLLWQEAAEVSDIRRGLEARHQELYERIQVAQKRGVNLHEDELLRKEEQEYWRIQEKLGDLKKQEAFIQELLEKLASGSIDVKELQRFLIKPEENKEELSKKKRRILEEKKRLGIDPREILYDMYGEFGSEKMHLTTGRHLKRVKLGNAFLEDAAGEFFYRTTDTHGGKVNYGKRGPTYVSPSGKRIRKK